MKKSRFIALCTSLFFLLSPLYVNADSVSYKGFKAKDITYGKIKIGETFPDISRTDFVTLDSNRLYKHGWELSVKSEDFNPTNWTHSIALDNNPKTLINKDSVKIASGKNIDEDKSLKGSMETKWGENPRTGNYSSNFTWTITPKVYKPKGIEGFWGTAPYILDDQGTLHIYKGELSGSIYNSVSSKINKDITKIEFEDIVTFPEDSTSLFNQTGINEIIDFELADTSKVKSFHRAFNSLNLNELDFRKLNTSNLTDMTSMFEYSNIDNLYISGIDTSKVKTMRNTFANFKSNNLEIRGLDTKNVSDFQDTFFQGKFNSLSLDGFNFSGIHNHDDMESFLHFLDVDRLEIKNLNLGSTNDLSYFFHRVKAREMDIRGLNTSNVTNMSYMFSYANIDNLSLNQLDTKNVTDMSNMFSVANFNKLDFSGINTSKLSNMSGMFTNADIIDLNLNGVNTSNVTDMSAMFMNSNFSVLDLSSFNTGKVSQMIYMFGNMKNLSTIYVGTGWDTKLVSDKTVMFSGSKNLKNYDSSKVTVTMANYNTGYLTLKK